MVDAHAKRAGIMVDTLVGVGAAALLAWIGGGFDWAWNTSSRITAVETKTATFGEWLERVENKLDRVVEDKPRGR